MLVQYMYVCRLGLFYSCTMQWSSAMVAYVKVITIGLRPQWEEAWACQARVASGTRVMTARSQHNATMPGWDTVLCRQWYCITNGSTLHADLLRQWAGAGQEGSSHMVLRPVGKVACSLTHCYNWSEDAGTGMLAWRDYTTGGRASRERRSASF